MSRHGRKVPASFYHRFARDTRVFANKHANGRVISVLEGGYSDRALISGAMAHTAGLADPKRGEVDESWWDVENLSMVSHLSALCYCQNYNGDNLAREVIKETSWRQDFHDYSPTRLA